MTKKGKIIVGLSGGVDSSMALVLLKEQGWEPIGVSLRYSVWQSKKNLLRENVCCSTESFAIAKAVCKKLDVPYHVYDVAPDFKKEVIDYFTSELKKNATPNPCVRCNRFLKFDKLFEFAKKQGVKYVATGHYAKTRNLEPGPTQGRTPTQRRRTGNQLLIAKDKDKDQTYSLSRLPQKWLKYIVFPLGDYTKPEIFKLAKKNKFEFFLKRKQSQDFCFVAGKSLKAFLADQLGTKIGDIVDQEGKKLDQHQGLHFYTIGQRKGLGLSGGPFYVTAKDKAKNQLIVSKDKKDLLRKEVLLTNCHFISGQPPKRAIRVKAKIRYQHQAAPATLKPLDGSKFQLVFAKPQSAVTPGQFAVFYQDDICLGNGII